MPDTAPADPCAWRLAIFPVIKASGKDWGIGLLLANATVERLGGSIVLLSRPEGGSCTRVSLPLYALRSQVAG